ncbi:MAG: ferrous iron transport protein B [Microcystaceae cyanobacterium]
MVAPCHGGSGQPMAAAGTKRVAFVGQPNTGKSTFFNRLTKSNAAIANWPGLTVELCRAVVSLDGEAVEFVDLPGIYDLNGFSEDERVVQRFLEQYAVHLVVVVINATQIDRQIRLLLQVKSLGLPILAVLNLADEAKRYGVQFDTQALGERLGLPVYAISAKYGTGCDRVFTVLTRLVKEMGEASPLPHLGEQLSAHPVDLAEQDAAIAGIVQMPSVTSRTLTNAIDGVMLHPIGGIPIFFASMFAVFWLIWTVGLPSADPVDAVTGWLQTQVLEPLFSPLPKLLQDLLLNGIWAGFAALLSFVPLVALFFVVMGLLEGSGYLSRAAYLMDALMGRLGLDGRGFVLQMMGFGCNVPAIMGTRVMRSRALRLLTMMVIPFSLCSARLQVFVFILAAVLPHSQGAIALFLLYVMSFVAAFGTAALLSRFNTFRTREPFVLELPPYRLPTITQILRRVWGEMQQFVSRLSLFMVIGTSLTWFLTSFPQGSTGLDTYAGQLGQLFQPLMNPLGINPFLTVTLIIGFVAKEVQIAALTVIYGLSDAGVTAELQKTMTFAQGFSFCLFSLLYIPCLTTIGTIWSESKSLGYTVLSVAFPLGLAWLVSFGFYQGAVLVGLG